MQQDYPYHSSPIFRLFLLFLMGMVVAQLAGSLMMQWAFPGTDVTQLSELAKAKPESWMAIRVLQFFHSTISYGLPALLLWKWVCGSWLPVFPQEERRHAGTMMLIPLLLVTLLPLMQLMYVYNQEMTLPGQIGQVLREMENQMNEVVGGLLKDRSPIAVGMNIFLLVVVAAVTEELFFRGVLQRLIFWKSGDEHKAIFFSAVLFSAVHMQFYGFLPRMALGLLFGYIYFRTRRLIAPILAHALFNGSQLASYYYLGSGAVDTGDGEMYVMPLPLTLSSLLLFSMLYYSFYQYTEKKT
jgi:membrane protease YdiL (CAAX protease family)